MVCLGCSGGLEEPTGSMGGGLVALAAVTIADVGMETSCQSWSAENIYQQLWKFVLSQRPARMESWLSAADLPQLGVETCLGESELCPTE